MAAALLTVLLLLVGLPLLAWWVAERRFWARLHPKAPHDTWLDLARAYGLIGGDLAKVSSAVSRGHRLDDERLRRAAVARASTIVRAGPRWRGGSRAQRWFFLLGVVWLALLLALTVLAVAGRRPAHVPWSVLPGITALGMPFWQRRMARRAIELNSAPSSRAGARG